MALTLSKLNMPVCNNHMEGTMSQIFDLGLSFHFLLKNGNIWVIFSHFIFYISLNQNEKLYQKSETQFPPFE